MQIIKPSDFSNQPIEPSKWVVNNLFRLNRKRVSLICGSPHAGKSTLARQLAIAVAHGQPFLDRETFQGKVAYWQSEETVEDANQDFTQSGMLPTDDPNLVVLQPDSKDNNLKELNDLLIADQAICLVIIETLDDFLKMDDLSDNPNARRAFEKFDAEVIATHRHRCCFVILHHFKKSDEQRGLNLNQILGATVIAGKTDAKVYMRRVSDQDERRYLSAQVRKGISIEPTYLDFDKGTQASTLGQTLADEKAEAKQATMSVNEIDLRKRCIDAVHNNLGKSKRDIIKIVGGKSITALNMLRTLIKDGDLEVRDGGLYPKNYGASVPAGPFCYCGKPVSLDFAKEGTCSAECWNAKDKTCAWHLCDKPVMDIYSRDWAGKYCHSWHREFDEKAKKQTHTQTVPEVLELQETV